MTHDKILIVDFGSQVTQLIARRVREEGVYCEIVPFNKAAEAFAEMKPRGRDPLGRPRLGDRGRLAARARRRSSRPACRCSASATASRRWRRSSAAQVEGGHHREFGRAEVEVVKDAALFEGVWERGQKYPVWMSHGDRVTRLPEGFEVIGVSNNAPFAAIADEKRKFYAVQFHPEVMHTPNGAALLRNFVRKHLRRQAATGPCAPSRARRSRRSARRSARAG